MHRSPVTSNPITRSSSGEHQTLVAERDRLRSEVRALTEQLQQVVEVEHALTQSRADGERQLDRIRRLAEFALDIAGTIEPNDVLAKARRALLEQFAVDGVAIIQLDDAQPVAATPGANTVMLDDQTWRLLKNLPGVGVDTATAPTAASLLTVVRALDAGCCDAAQSVTWIPVRPAVGDRVVLCGWASYMAAVAAPALDHFTPTTRNRVESRHRDIPQTEHIPFLELFGEHIKRALDSAEVTVELRRQKADLAESNRRLHTSLQALERTQAQLVQAQKLDALGKLASGIAHDFNNLLTVIVTHAHLVQPTIEARSEASADLKVVVDAAMRAGEITQRLLAFSRQHKPPRSSVDQTPHSGDGHAAHADTAEAIDVNAIALEISRTLRQAIANEIVVELDLDPGVARVRAYSGDLEQVLSNVVSNAREAMPHGGKLTIQTRHASRADKAAAGSDPNVAMIAVCVRDSGIGMDDETRRHLFEPFFTTKPLGHGSGLGLATAYGLVVKNEGRIYVDSAPGQGTCVTVLLPSADGLCGADLHAPTAVKVRGHILVVEDEPAIRRMISRVLRRAEFDVAEACDGEQALEIAQQLPDLDLLITDVAMPSMSGPDLVVRLREFAPRLRVVFMSGYTFDRLDVANLDASTEAFLAKPFTPTQLESAVETAFGR